MRFPASNTLPSQVRAAAIVFTALALGACARVPAQSASMGANPELAVTASQLQLQAFEMGRTLSMIIEQAADSIQLASADPVVRRNALLWKISAIPLVQEAALRNDPHVATVDLLAFTIQLSNYLTTGSGRASFGSEQPIAVAAAGDAERAAMNLVAGSLASGQMPATAQTNIRKWAAGHPMQGPALRRASILESDWQALGLSDNSFMATVGNVDRTLVNISYRLSYLNETMILEARWNAELSAGEAMRSPRVDSLLGTSTATLRSVGTLSDTLPALIDTQREAMMHDIDLERIAMMRDIDRQRVLAFRDLAVQREALQAALSAERATLMAQVGQERVAAFLSADSLAQRSIGQSGVMLRQLALEILVAGLVSVAALVGGGFLLINRWRATPA